jgi:hypothetical protein
MNSIDAAYKVLQEAGRPLHYTEIARQVVANKLWLTSGKTPENTINRDINQEILHRGKLSRFVRLGDGMYAAVPQACPAESKILAPDIAFVVEAWGHLPVAAKQKILHAIRAALTGQTDEVDDPVISALLPDGAKSFPTDFLNGQVEPTHSVELPEEQIAVRQVAGGGYVIESHFGFRREVRNETEGMFMVYAHARGVRVVNVPDEMIHVFKVVKGYEGYLRTLWADLYHTYGRECGDRTAAYSHAKTAFDTLGLPVPIDQPAVPSERDDDSDDRRPRRRRGTRTPETAFYEPILKALIEVGGSGRTAEIVDRVGQIMAGTLTAEDRESLPSTGMARWDTTCRFARHSMVRNGLLDADSPHGIWRVAEKGEEYLRNHAARRQT